MYLTVLGIQASSWWYLVDSTYYGLQLHFFKKKHIIHKHENRPKKLDLCQMWKVGWGDCRSETRLGNVVTPRIKKKKKYKRLKCSFIVRVLAQSMQGPGFNPITNRNKQTRIRFAEAAAGHLGGVWALANFSVSPALLCPPYTASAQCLPCSPLPSPHRQCSVSPSTKGPSTQ